MIEIPIAVTIIIAGIGMFVLAFLLMLIYYMRSLQIVVEKMAKQGARKSKASDITKKIVKDLIVTIKAMEVDALQVYTPGDYRDGIYNGLENVIRAVKIIAARVK